MDKFIEGDFMVIHLNLPGDPFHSLHPDKEKGFDEANHYLVIDNGFVIGAERVVTKKTCGEGA